MSIAIAGGVESMSRAPFVMGKATTPFARNPEIFDTTLGWRFINPVLQKAYGTDSMAETGENVAEDYKIDRESQDKFALWSQQKAAAAQKAGFFAEEIAPVIIPGPKGTSKTVCEDEHIRADTTLEGLAKLPTPFSKGGTVTAGNASGINDGACALLLASEEAVKRHGLKPRARVIGTAVAGVAPRVMGLGPIPATRKLLARIGQASSWAMPSLMVAASRNSLPDAFGSPASSDFNEIPRLMSFSWKTSSTAFARSSLFALMSTPVSPDQASDAPTSLKS